MFYIDSDSSKIDWQENVIDITGTDLQDLFIGNQIVNYKLLVAGAYRQSDGFDINTIHDARIFSNCIQFGIAGHAIANSDYPSLVITGYVEYVKEYLNYSNVVNLDV